VDDERMRGWVALILATTVGIGSLLLTAAALLDVLRDPTQAGISPEYAALITTTLGVLVGGLVGYIGGREREKTRTPDRGEEP
jgi:hypothetical protein